MTFVSTDPSSNQSENTWFTPKLFSDTLGVFDLDPCTMSFRPHDMAKINIEYDVGHNGLMVDWMGDVWLNPPYGKEIMPFVDKFISHKRGVMLVFARMGSPYLQKCVGSGAYIFCLRKRVKFISRGGLPNTNAGTDSCLVFFEEKWKDKIINGFEGVLIRGSK